MDQHRGRPSGRMVLALASGLLLFVQTGCTTTRARQPNTAAAAPAAAGHSGAAGSGGINAAEWLATDPVILISFDGFRYDYLDRGITPNFDRLISRGVRADALIPVFPTKTYTNHYSVATGMYGGRHGLVANDFYDPAWDAFYRLSDRSAVEDGRWYGGEPIWVTAETQGMVSAAMFFVGTEAPVQGVYPTYWNIYDHQLPTDVRIGHVLDWLSMTPERRPRLITLYFAFTDDHGHWGGPESGELDDAIREADAALGALIDGVAALPDGDRVNYVIVSDHGMMESVGSVVLDDYADLENTIVVDAGPLALLYFRGDTARRDVVLEGLRSAPHVRVFRRDEIPAEWGVRENPRIGDILVVADDGWLVTRRGRSPGRNIATHGWPPGGQMNGIFIAAGPGIRSGVRIPAFENVHIYPLLAALLGLEPNADIDGRADVLAPILAHAPGGQPVPR